LLKFFLGQILNSLLMCLLWLLVALDVFQELYVCRSKFNTTIIYVILIYHIPLNSGIVFEFECKGCDIESQKGCRFQFRQINKGQRYFLP
jgi:hypothetical protein